MILKQNETNEAALEYAKSQYEDWNDNLYCYEIKDFKAGVEFAESKFEEIAIEFGRFAYEHYEDSYLSFEELFQLFIKKRNEQI